MKIFIFFLWMILTFQSLSIGLCSAETNKRPFWTKQSSFMEGEDLFVVGSAPHAATVEEGRKQAFERCQGRIDELCASHQSRSERIGD